MNILEKIIEHKKTEVASAKASTPVAELEKRPFFSREALSLRASLGDPDRAGIIAEFPAQLAQTLELVPERTPRGVVLCSARLGTNDLEETIAFWRRERVPVWGVVPERVGIASGPEARLHREGLEHYGEILKRLARSAR